MSILQEYNRVLSFPKIREYLIFERNHPTDPIVEKVIFSGVSLGEGTC